MSDTFTRDPQPRIRYAGDGVRISFDLPFPILASDDLLAFVDDQPATGFAIAGLGEPTAKITFLQPPAAGATVTLLRRTESIRETEFVDGGPFRAAAINAELDRVMLLIQENREEHNRALRARPFEGDLDFCLPPAAQRANRLLGFDSSGQPMIFGQSELPIGGDASGQLVTPAGATTARALGEHLAFVVNVRDFGALGDGVSDDGAAFQSALAAAQARSGVVYVPAGPNPYLLGSALVLDGVRLIGDGPGSVLKVAVASGFGLQLTGDAPRLSGLRLIGPGAGAWPQGAEDVNLAGVALDGVQIAAGARDAMLHGVEVAACHTGLAIEGPVGAIVDCRFLFCRNGSEVRAGGVGSIHVARTTFHGCSSGMRADAGSLFARATLAGGTASSCGRAIDLVAPASGRRVVEISNLELAGNLEADVRIGPRHAVAVRGCCIDATGKRSGVGLELLASGETDLAPGLIVENTWADVTEVSSVQLSGGSNLDLLEPGDLIVLGADSDDVDDLWTALKAGRAGVVHSVISQTTESAEIALARAGNRPLIQTDDLIRVVGRSGTATVDSIAAATPAATFAWLRADDYTRVLSAQNPMPADQIDLVGSNAELRHFPGISDEPVAISGVELRRGAVNGALTRLVTLELAQDTAASFAPDSTVGMVHVFGHAALGDPSAAMFTYRADGLAYTELLARADNDPPTVKVTAATALTGTTGESGVFTFSAHTDGRIYVENRMVGSPRTLSLFLIGAPL
ncbi:MAG TPA: glycosyl hydrolase family 28-related protein [Geminicoccaceae bacterium]|nr:glycosyl hydrolase family 28-related protein [Geminicoccaceae bacterium]